ncbi:MAG: RNA polymerase sigma factor [Reichenbachiella sp.]
MKVENKDIHYHLIEAAKNQDNAAQFELYNLYAKAMLNVSFRIVNNRDEAEDVLQEAFINVFRNINSYRGESSFGSWVKRIVINSSLNVLKKRKLDTSSLEDTGIDVVEENDLVTEELSVENIQKVVALLPEGFRVVFTLYAFEGYDHKEIAEILNVSESTSKSQYNRAKKKMKMLLKEVYDYER